MAKLPNGGLNNGVARDKDFIDVLRPTRQEGEKLAVNSGAEGSASGGTPTKVNGAIAKPSDKAGEPDTSGEWPKIGYEEIKEFIHGELLPTLSTA